MEVQELANLDQRVASWKRDLLRITREIGIFGVVFTLLMTMVVHFFSQYYDLGWSSWDALVYIGLFAAFVLAPVVFFTAGRKPTQSDVDEDRSLRRAYGMSDKVSGE